ncbi:MAG: nitrous oxide reductase family maturation protein NosD [Burkholderiales bacterium]|jgi:nitrous oxidase accessory protein|uniref:Copper ABC transporter substrate-binding protein n=1 Tax=Candidatus Desulfobacillus denitrificans TaxID=2608985 RepID=A0A809R3D8_9PROT|nr:nitrous oxide reductase family maturation protein NosD [Zoogloeaceae bacterium]MBP9653343.1 nitrous oxide reductase family maturation protein NosD [Rhodocyclaceae bacterium]MCZ2175728.1 nitrous oxide reductase family maturation protein NosD [Burkholderiales bacterium]OQY73261.1 MAG: copper ABC transporter substrate-binding protein [Rhodocyclaceae bacterium UTPRO2]BBO22110.1 copper ABC transporter substrate-binding protein [Candidatus Desulfobacillus denitrificans]GIK46943.1 MAG: hypothetica
MRRAGALLALLIAAAAFGDGDEPARKVDSAAHGGVRADVDRPKPVFMLHERDKRVHGLKPFQELVDAAPAGATLKPAPGSYAGPVRLDKPLVIDGGGQVTIDAGGKGTVFSLETDGAVLRGLTLRGSGESHDTDDACLDVRGHRNVIEQLVITDCLFGIDLKQSNANLVRNNRISSKPLPLGVRGDALRLWYSNDNRIEGNDISDSRDMVAWYSHGNAITGNTGRRSRYSIHFMFATYNLVEDNRFYDNAVGIYLMYTEGVHVRRNVISHATGATGMGIGFKEASDAIIEGNEIIYCAIGVQSDLSPFQPGTKIEFRGNRIAYNGIGMLFTSELGGNIATGNDFEGNLTHVAQAGRNTGGLNEWRGNHWDDYQGFDRNGDGTGDTPYELYAFADRIWMEIPQARFFKTSPALELLDFLERLAPFSSPELMLKDDAPRFGKPERNAHERS